MPMEQILICIIAITLALIWTFLESDPQAAKDTAAI